MDGDEVDLREKYNEMMKWLEEEDEDLLRNIMPQPAGHYLTSQTESESKGSFSNHGWEDENHVLMSPRACILQFDDHDVKPMISKQEDSNKKRCSSRRITGAKHNSEPSNKKKRRSLETVMDHIMAERRRRRQITEGFAALSATIPGLKKLDKATILHEAIKYVKQLQERVKELEKESSIISIKRIEQVCENHDDFCEVNEELPKIEVRVSEKQVLLGIHCQKQKGIEFQILSLLENFHLHVSSSSVLSFGNSTLGITIIAQVGDEYRMPVNEVMKNLRQILLKSHNHEVDPY